MSVPKSHVFLKGRPTNPHEAVTSVMRYIPRARTPWNPSEFWRQNIMPADLTPFWNMGRGRTGPAFPNSGYFTGKNSIIEENTIDMIPKAQLEKYMPDIWLGPKALVTPVSMMSVRAGHRVTHDMIHSYDPFIGQMEKAAVVDHDNISPHDPNRVGLHPATIHSRGRIYRWLRRGPFFQDDHYFRRNVAPEGNYEKNVTPEDIRLAKKVIRIASKGHLKAASEEYRKFVSVPPVQVYRALTAACIGQGKIADAVAIFEDGNSKLFYVARDAEVLTNLMRTAIVARNRSRILWVYNLARGRFHENQLVRAEIDAIAQYEMARLALEYFADNGCVEEARTVYDFLSGEESIHQQQYLGTVSGLNNSASTNNSMYYATAEAKSMTDFDLYKAAGLRLREALAKGEAIPAYTPALGADLALSKNVAPIADLVVKVLNATTANATEAVSAQKDNESALQYLSRRFADVDVACILRHTRFVNGGKTDLLAGKPTEEQLRSFADRAISWLKCISRANAQRSDDIAMPYLRKSKPSAVNPNIRVAYLPETLQRTRLMAGESGYSFHFGRNDRFVAESYAQRGQSLESQVLALQPNHTPVDGIVSFSKKKAAATATPISAPSNNSASRLLGYDPKALADRRRQKVLHHTVTAASRPISPSMATAASALNSSRAAAAADSAPFTAVSSARPNAGAVDANAAAARIRDIAPDADRL